MSVSIIPSSPPVVTPAFGVPATGPYAPHPRDDPSPSVRQEWLYPGAQPVLTNAPSGMRLCWRCGTWQREAAFRSISGACASCRWSPRLSPRACVSHREEVCHAALP